MLVKMKIERECPCPNKLLTERQWPEEFPFVVNPRAQLIHRARSSKTYYYDGQFSHNATGLWCGNQFNGIGCKFAEVPPEDRLLCERCEALAVQAGEKSASELAGHHVHVGRMVPIRTCCKQGEN